MKKKIGSPEHRYDDDVEVSDHIFHEYSEDAHLFKTLCGFSRADFEALYGLLAHVLAVQRR
jgi:hypothetical protein